MNTDKIITFVKDNWLKAVIAIVVAVVLYIVVKKAIKSIRSGSANRQARRENANLVVEIENAGGKPPELTTVQSKQIAANIYDAIAGWGTDEDKLIKAVKQIPTAADYFNVKVAYIDAYEADMWTDICDDLTTDDEYYGQINAHLNLIAVPENLR